MLLFLSLIFERQIDNCNPVPKKQQLKNSEEETQVKVKILGTTTVDVDMLDSLGLGGS